MIDAPDRDLASWAAANVDMVPHTDTLTRLARGVSTIFEMGVRGGASTWALLDGLPASGRMTSVDIDERCLTHKVPDRVRNDPRWRFIVGDDTDPAVRAYFPESAELVFIDTSHVYAHTVIELGIARYMGARLIVLHDWELHDVADAVLGFAHREPYTLEVESSQWGLAILERTA